MENIKNLDVYALEKSVLRSGYPKQTGEPKDLTDEYVKDEFEKAMVRGRKLGKVNTGTGHDNYLKGIIVQFDLKYTQYLTPQLQRYNWIDIISSQSKMHRLTKNKDTAKSCNKYVLEVITDTLDILINIYNNHDFKESSYLVFDKKIETKEQMFECVLSNCPLGYELWMGITTNYLQLKTIRQQRRTHDLQDWKDICSWIDTLPYFNQLTSRHYDV